MGQSLTSLNFIQIGVFSSAGQTKHCISPTQKSRISPIHLVQAKKGFTWGFPSWILIPGNEETGLGLLGPSAPRPWRNPIFSRAAD